MEDFISQLLSSVKGIWQYRWFALAVMWIVALGGWRKVPGMPDAYQARVFVVTQGILQPLMAGMTTLPNVEQQVAIMRRSLLSRPKVERLTRTIARAQPARTAREHGQQVDERMARITIGAPARTTFTRSAATTAGSATRCAPLRAPTTMAITIEAERAP